MEGALLANKIAIVTGGGRGIGRALVRAFASAGAAGIAIVSSSSPHEVEEAAEEANQIGGRDVGLPIVADVRDDAACHEAVAKTVERFGGLHILVNNAGLGMKAAADTQAVFWDTRPDGWVKVIDVNVNGPYYMARHSARHLIAGKWGRIINVSKTVDTIHEMKNSPYGPSKAALEAMTICWAQDFLGLGVTANVVLPGGLTATTFARRSAVDDARKAGRPVFEADEMGPLVVALSSELSSRYNGCRFNARGWDPHLSPLDALEACRTDPIFRKPRRKRDLTSPWDPNAGADLA